VIHDRVRGDPVEPAPEGVVAEAAAPDGHERPLEHQRSHVLAHRAVPRPALDEAEDARQIAREKGIDQRAIDRAVNEVRYPV
jgi:hypothetical protein